MHVCDDECYEILGPNRDKLKPQNITTTKTHTDFTIWLQVQLLLLLLQISNSKSNPSNPNADVAVKPPLLLLQTLLSIRPPTVRHNASTKPVKLIHLLLFHRTTHGVVLLLNHLRRRRRNPFHPVPLPFRIIPRSDTRRRRFLELWNLSVPFTAAVVEEVVLRSQITTPTKGFRRLLVNSTQR